MNSGLFISIPLLLGFAFPAIAEVPRVVTDVPVTYALVSEVLGTLGKPVLLLDSGEDAHSFQLRPSQAGALKAAGFIVWIGPELTPWLERSLSSVSDVPELALIDVNGMVLRRYDEGATEETDAGDATDPSEPNGADPGKEREGIDPHIWLDPDNAALGIGAIADALAELDPEHAATYRANASLAQARIVALDENIAASLANVHDKPFVVSHDALGYFAAHYDLTIAGSITSGDAAAPGAAHLSDLRGRLESGDIVCIFPEAGQDPKQLSVLAEGTPARIGPALDPEGRAIVPGAILYRKLMVGLSAALKDCLAEAG